MWLLSALLLQLNLIPCFGRVPTVDSSLLNDRGTKQTQALEVPSMVRILSSFVEDLNDQQFKFIATFHFPQKRDNNTISFDLHDAAITSSSEASNLILSIESKQGTGSSWTASTDISLLSTPLKVYLIRMIQNDDEQTDNHLFYFKQANFSKFDSKLTFTMSPGGGKAVLFRVDQLPLFRALYDLDVTYARNKRGENVRVGSGCVLDDEIIRLPQAISPIRMKVCKPIRSKTHHISPCKAKDWMSMSFRTFYEKIQIQKQLREGGLHCVATRLAPKTITQVFLEPNGAIGSIRSTLVHDFEAAECGCR